MQDNKSALLEIIELRKSRFSTSYLDPDKSHTHYLRGCIAGLDEALNIVHDYYIFYDVPTEVTSVINF